MHGLKPVAIATGTSAKQITDWCNQGQIIGQREPLGKGRKREFSFFNVMEIAGAVALMQVGVRSPADAFKAAASFRIFQTAALAGLATMHSRMTTRIAGPDFRSTTITATPSWPCRAICPRSF